MRVSRPKWYEGFETVLRVLMIPVTLPLYLVVYAVGLLYATVVVGFVVGKS